MMEHLYEEDPVRCACPIQHGQSLLLLSGEQVLSLNELLNNTLFNLEIFQFKIT